MTDEEIIRHLAEKVMGWKESYGGADGPVFRFVIGGIYPRGWRVFHSRFHTGRDWNPLESCDDCAEVEAALSPAEKAEYAHEVLDRYFDEDQTAEYDQVSFALYLPPRQRCLAMVEATR